MNEELKQKNKQINNYILLIFFIAFIFIIGIGTIINSTGSYKKAKAVDYDVEAWIFRYDIDTNLKVNVLGKSSFINMQGFFSRLINQSVLNNVVRLNNNQLTEPQDLISEELIRRSAERIAHYQNLIKSEGKDFLFILTPMKICRYDNSQLPLGIYDYTKENQELFLSYLDELGVNYIDSEELIHNNNLNHYDLFFMTDHHWTPECGFMIYLSLASYLENNCDSDIDSQTLDLNNYILTTYSNFHLGSLGQRVGRFFGPDADDITKIVPNWDVTLEDVTEDTIGSYEEIMLDTSVLEKRDYSQRLVYDNLYGKALYHHIRNNQSQNNKTVLIQTDSMGKVVVPYLTLSYRDVYWTDISEETIAETNADIFIFMMYPNNLLYYAND